jgi:hypothetical protein
MLAAGSDFEDPSRRRFSEIVSDADLSCSLGCNVFDKACGVLTGTENGQKYATISEDQRCGTLVILRCPQAHARNPGPGEGWRHAEPRV